MDPDDLQGIGFDRASKSDTTGQQHYQECQDIARQQQQQQQQIVQRPVLIPPSTSPTDSPPPSPHVSAAAAAALKKARAIVLKFNTDPPNNNDTDPPRIVDVQALRSAENHRMHKAFLKNFEYLARKDDTALQHQILRLDRMRNRDAALAAAKEEASSDAVAADNADATGTGFACAAGIGSKNRKRQLKNLEKTHHGVNQKGQQENTVSFYVSGLGGEEDDPLVEEKIGHLFGSYGTVRRIKLYRDSTTKRWKGDALVVLLDDGTFGMEDVCGQLNGAELPSGAVMTVQPAVFHSKKNKIDPSEQRTNKTDSHIHSGKDRPGCTKVKHDATEDLGEDLDDFFASLS